MAPPLITTVPSVCVVKLVSGVVPPTTPPKVTVAVPIATVNAYPPLIVLEKVISLLVVVSVVAAPKVTAPV